MSNITIVMHYMGLLVMCENILVHFAAEKPEYGGSDLLLSNDFLRECAAEFSVPSRTVDTSTRIFTEKHLNIVDPLKENNNLGRSVSKGTNACSSFSHLLCE